MATKPQRFDPRQIMHRDNFEIFHYKDTAVHRLEAHYHDFYEVFYFIAGDVDYWVEGNLYHFAPGDILLINPTELHKPVARTDVGSYERIVLWINKNYLSNIWGDFDTCFNKEIPTYKRILRPTAAEGKNEVARLFSDLVREYNSEEFGAKQSAYGLLLCLLTSLNRISLESRKVSGERHKTGSLVAEVLEYIAEHFSEELTLEALSKHFFISKYHLAHEFSKAVGMGIHRYITLKRLGIAREMLEKGVSAGQVGLSCGFGDYTSFFRAFKAEYGISPRECSDGVG